MTLLNYVQKLAIKTRVPKVEPGLTVKVHQKIQEGGKSRIQIFEGIIIKVNSGVGADKTFTVRKVVDGIGVEKTFPLFSTIIDKIEVIKLAKVRRAKLYYLRERFGKSARMKEELISAEKMKDMFIELPVEEKAEKTPVVENLDKEVEQTVKEELPVEEAKKEEE